MNKKRLLAAILSASMVLALAACGGGGGGAASSNPATSTPATSTPAASTPSTGGDETIYIPVMAKGFQHQFWQAVKAGAEAAATDLGVEIYFDGPASETEIDKQVNMVKTEMAKNPKAMALAAL